MPRAPDTSPFMATTQSSSLCFKSHSIFVLLFLEWIELLWDCCAGQPVLTIINVHTLPEAQSDHNTRLCQKSCKSLILCRDIWQFIHHWLLILKNYNFLLKLHYFHFDQEFIENVKLWITANLYKSGNISISNNKRINFFIPKTQNILIVDVEHCRWKWVNTMSFEKGLTTYKICKVSVHCNLKIPSYLWHATEKFAAKFKEAERAVWTCQCALALPYSRSVRFSPGSAAAHYWSIDFQQ